MDESQFTSRAPRSAAACALLAGTSPAEQDLAAKPVFTDGEIKIILSHGPWPAPAQSDPTNRVSGKPEAIEFGTRLFCDQRSPEAGNEERCIEKKRGEGEGRGGNDIVLECHVRSATGPTTSHAASHERGRSQHAERDESAREPLVRMERRVRQPVVAEPPPDPG